MRGPERKTTRFSFDNPCPVCLSNLDACTHISGEKDGTPREGDLTVCVYCGAPLIFTKNLRYKVLPSEALNDPQLPEIFKRAMERFRKTCH